MNNLLKNLEEILKRNDKPLKDISLILEYFDIDNVFLVDKTTEIEVLNFTNEYALSDYPLQYLVGFEIFLGEKIYVDLHVLIPRQETEELVIEICNDLKKRYKLGDTIHILDIGTGSGAIIIGLNKVLADDYNLIYTASDISEKALEIAQKNFQNKKIKVRTIASNIFDNIPVNNYDIVVSNPPYIDRSDKSVAGNVAKYEPFSALYAEDNGLYIYKEILNKIDNYVRENGMLYFEIGYNQGVELKIYINVLNLFHKVTLIKDLNQRERIIKCFR